MSAVRTRIANRALAPGDRLPSVRRFAETMRVSPSTVVEAYDRPGGRRHHSGAARLRILRDQREPAAGALAERGSPRERDVDPFWVSRQSPRCELPS